MWQFNSPEIVYGEDSLSRLADIHGRCAVMITDPTMVALGYSQMVLDQLATGVEVTIFRDVEPEPSVQTTRRARRILDELQPDHVVALGGGSVLDVAKVAWFSHEHPEVGLDEISIFDSYATPKSKLIAIPTTSGSGAEVTPAAALTDVAGDRKLTIYARELQPTLVIVDPIVTGKMPRQLTVDTGLDVISHAIEAFTGAWHNDFADSLSVHALRLALRYLPQCSRNGADARAREHMHNAATIAGMAITNSSIALGHALAHSLGATLSIPHGRAIGVMLPVSMAYTANGGGTRYAQLARLLGYQVDSEAEGVTALLSVLNELLTSLGQPNTIRELGVGRSEFEHCLPALVSGAAQDHQLLTTVRVPGDDELARLFRCAYDGTEVAF